MAQSPVRSNIYTVLTIIAFVALALGVAYLWYMNLQLTGHENNNPFFLES